MENTAGFYCLIDNELHHAPNFVSAPTFELNASNEADRLMEIDGWKYFSSVEDAKLHHGLV